jgi:hypothetical protein
MGKKQNVGPSKQDKRIKKEKAAKEVADSIVEKAIEKAKKEAVKKMGLPSYPAEWDGEKKEGVSDVDWLAAISVRLLREEGEPWWAIAKALEMEGAGDSATTGKKGAARARQAYAKGFGAHPRTFTRGAYKGAQETNNHVLEIRKMKRTEAKARAKAGKSVIKKKVPDEDVALMIRGRKIKWYSTEYFPEGIDYEATVHPSAPIYVYEDAGERVVEFREQHRRAPKDVRHLPAQTRTVRVRQIYAIIGHQEASLERRDKVSKRKQREERLARAGA